MVVIQDYSSDVERYCERVDKHAVKKIIRHLGIALQSRDASLVAASDRTELERVREKWLKKRLRLKADDVELDSSIDHVCNMMSEQRFKSTSHVLLSVGRKIRQT